MLWERIQGIPALINRERGINNVKCKNWEKKSEKEQRNRKCEWI